ncbi:MAG: palindromic element RPE5 domain-containing protein [Rickettsia endosymbiont of Pentastiridius leporinus]
MEKSNRFVSQGAERTKVREHLKVYKDIVANLRDSASILLHLSQMLFYSS